MSATSVASVPALPTKKSESWRYAPHAKLGELTFASADSLREVPVSLESQIPDLDGPTLVVVNGVVDATRSNVADLPDGLSLLSFSDGAAAMAELAARDQSEGDDAFTVLNRMHATDGAIVRITSSLSDIVHIVHVLVPEAGHNSAACRVLIDVAAGARATVVETHVGEADELGSANAHTAIAVGEAAELEHIILQDLSDSQMLLARVDAHQQAESTYTSRLFNLGADYGRVFSQVELHGEAAHADLSGLYFGFGEQTLDQQIQVVHAVPNCTSRQSFRGVLDDASTGVWIGGVDVRPGADGTDSEQSNDNLLLSKRADINTQPRLEILADEVKCAHGATVGQLDETALYYMRSRGIPKDEASALLINGFADQVMDELTNETIRSWILERLGHERPEAFDLDTAEG